MLHTYMHDLFLLKNTTYTQGFYFIAMLLCIIACFSITWFTPLRFGSFAHACTKTFSEKYHKINQIISKNSYSVRIPFRNAILLPEIPLPRQNFTQGESPPLKELASWGSCCPELPKKRPKSGGWCTSSIIQWFLDFWINQLSYHKISEIQL